MKLAVKNISKRYGKIKALDGVSFEMENGVYGLLGPNGAGKSTLIRILAGVIEPTSGELIINGKNRKACDLEYRSKLGYLPQTLNFYPEFSGLDYLRFVAALKGLKGDSIERIIKEPVTKQVAVGTKPPPPRQGTGTFSYPARGTITSKFGWRWGRRHNGIDIGLPVGTPVKAADGGTVKFSGKYGGFGNLVIIDHGDGYESYYGHNEKNLVSKGDKVHKGQTIALSGNTGNSTGPHLHFEVRRFGAPVNPLNYLKD
jgi:murein DD-endopeptidase MepM/ murein hydrolase activator NlpD